MLVMAAATTAQADSLWPAWLGGDQRAGTSIEAAPPVAALRARPETAGPALAVHVTPEGHWQLANKQGETFTAGTVPERGRAITTLLPGGTGGFAGVALVLSQGSLFAGRDALAELPAARELLVMIDGVAVPLLRGADGGQAVEVRPGVRLMVGERDMFTEALAQVRRPLDAKRVRILAATAGGPKTLTATARFDAAEGGAALDSVDADHVAEALASIPRQLAILTARLDGATLVMQPASGPARQVPYGTLVAAADANDVDLLVLHAEPPRQPGGRNWLWQSIKVAGLAHANKRGTLGDVLEELARGRDPFQVTVSADGRNRVRLVATPVAQSLVTAAGVTGWLKQAADAVTGQVTGTVQAAAVHAILVSEARRQELSRRLIVGLPSGVQWVYFACAALGLVGLPVAVGWWRRIWPAEARADYGGIAGFALARAVRGLVFVAVFLPLVAVPAALMQGVRMLARPLGGTAQPR